MGSMTIEIKNNLGKDVDASFVDGKKGSSNCID